MTIDIDVPEAIFLLQLLANENKSKTITPKEATATPFDTTIMMKIVDAYNNLTGSKAQDWSSLLRSAKHPKI